MFGFEDLDVADAHVGFCDHLARDAFEELDESGHRARVEQVSGVVDVPA